MKIKNYLSLLSVLALINQANANSGALFAAAGIYKIPEISKMNAPNQDKMLFSSGLADNPDMCVRNITEDIVPQSAKSNMSEFLDYTCQAEETIKLPTSYCACINGKQANIKGKTTSERIGAVKKLKDELYASRLAELVSISMFKYLKVADIVGYSALIDKDLRNKLGEFSCAPGSFKKSLDKIAAKSKRGKSCIEKLNNDKLTVLFNNKFNQGSANYSKLNIASSINDGKLINDLISATDLNVTKKFKEDLSKIYDRPLYLKDYDISDISSIPEDFDNFSALEKEKMASLFELNQRLENGEEVSDELFLKVQATYLTNPILRRLKRNVNFERNNSLSNSYKSPQLINNLLNSTKNMNEISDEDKVELAAFTKGLMRAMNKKIANLNNGEMKTKEDFFKAQKYLLEKKVGEFANNCSDSFKQIDDFCNTSDDNFLVGLKPEALSSLVDEAQFIDDAAIEDAKNAHMTLGFNYCHLRSCSEGADGEISKECSDKSIANTLASKTIPISNSLDLDTFKNYSTFSSEEVTDTKIVYGDAYESFGSSAGESSSGPISNNIEQGYVGSGTIEEPMLDTSIDPSFAAGGTNFGGDNPYAYSPSVGSVSSATSPSVASSTTSYLDSSSPEANQDINSNIEVAEGSREKVSDEKSDSFKKELDSINKKLSSYKEESENAKRELEEFKAQKLLEDQERIMAEKEKAMRNNLSSLEEKIRKLENEKANISQQIPTRYSNPNKHFSSASNSYNNDFSNQGGAEVNQVSDFSGNKFSQSAPTSSSSGGKQIFNSGVGKSAFTGGSRSSASVGQSVISLSSKDDPSLGAKVREAYNNGVETLYVTIGGNYYRVTPKKDNRGNLILENGEVALNFEITTTAIAQTAVEDLPVGLLRAPAAVEGEAVIAPTPESENAIRYNDLLSKLREDK